MENLESVSGAAAGSTIPAQSQEPTITPQSAGVSLEKSIGTSESIDNNEDLILDAPIKRGRGRPRKDRSDSIKLSGVRKAKPRESEPIQDSGAIKTIVQPAKIVDYEALGKVAANLWFNVGQIVFGADWEPQADEIQPVKNGFKDYFEATGVQGISPGVQLSIVLGSYTLARVAKPTVKSRITNMFLWAKSKFQR